jgi:hypothetical protein
VSSCANCVPDPDDPVIDRMIAASANPGKWQLSLFTFSRHLKTIPQFASQPAVAHQQHVRRWHASRCHARPWDDVWSLFTIIWPRIKVPFGQGLLALAHQRALTAPFDSRAVALYGECAAQDLVRLCRELQQMTWPEPFFLSCRDAALLLAVSRMAVWRYLLAFCKNRILDPGTVGRRKTKKASEFFFNPEQEKSL